MGVASIWRISCRLVGMWSVIPLRVKRDDVVAAFQGGRKGMVFWVPKHVSDGAV